MLRGAGLTRLKTLALQDHYDFNTLPWPDDAQDVIVTEKDAVKLKPSRVGGDLGGDVGGDVRNVRVWVAPLDFALHPASCAALLTLLPSLSSLPHPSPAQANPH